ncbi:hypothetical protein [Opitutus sp. GAS368]|uniref:hypothetical protein n=1 Tax=Opitutus sp. GAS368 TaxID=1882749 RepID=UPI0012FDFE86|nr:hypothetical protein [Opitutus sp. GAS368]
MKAFLVSFLVCAVAGGQGCAKEIFSARGEFALSRRANPEWRVTETDKGLLVEYTDRMKEKHSTFLVGSAADSLRALLTKLTFTQADADFLRKTSMTQPAKKNGEESIMIRPFDGVTYYFVFHSAAGTREAWIDNPSFDLENNSHAEQRGRLKAVLDFLDIIERQAKGEKESNQKPVSTPSTAP